MVVPMKEKLLYPRLVTGFIAAALITAPIIALFFVGDVLAGLPLVPFSLMDFAARNLPGDVITFGIDSMVTVIRGLNLGPTDQVAKLAEQTMGVLGLFALGTLLGGLLFLALRRVENRQTRFMIGLGTGAVLGGVLALLVLRVDFAATAAPEVSAVWIIGVFAAWGYALSWVFNDLVTLPATKSEAASGVTQLDRREFLVRVGGATAVLTVLGAGVRLVSQPGEETAQPIARTTDPGAGAADEVVSGVPGLDSDGKLKPAPGTRPEYTPLEDHYRIDISTRPPVIDGASWALPITGLVANPVMLTLDDFRNNYESQDVIVTMSCISNRLGGDLISTTRWTGVSVQQILETIQPLENGRFMRITSADGFDEVMEIALAENDSTVMFAYEWDGQPLTEAHGFPLRIHIPNRFGMKQPKWITSIEIIEDWEEGYWVRRGWSQEAIVRTTSVVDTIAVEQSYEADGQTFIPVGGIAWASKRGISKVEVSVDDGEWVEAQLREPLSDRSWVVWRYDWPFAEGRHTFAVRAYDGTETLQILDVNPVRPDGATGVHNLSRSV